MKKVQYQTIKKYSLRFGVILLCLFLVVISAMTYFPNATSNILSIHFYPVETEGSNSIVQKNDVVVSFKNSDIKLNDQLVVQVERLGKTVFLTQTVTQFHTMGTGEIYYKTSNLDTNAPEEYLVQPDKVIGQYLFSIPYLGLIMIFMKSKYMIVLLLIVSQIYLYRKLKDIDKKEIVKQKKSKREYIMITRMCIEHKDNEIMISGVIENHLRQSVKCVIAQLEVYNKNQEQILNKEWDVLEQKVLSSGQSIKFSYTIPYTDDVVDYALRIRKYKY